MTLFDALLLGALEGVSEFLPISSTGHLILASQLLGIEQTTAHKAFEVAIQLGSILAVLFLSKFRNSAMCLVAVMPNPRPPIAENIKTLFWITPY